MRGIANKQYPWQIIVKNYIMRVLFIFDFFYFENYTICQIQFKSFYYGIITHNATSTNKWYVLHHY